MSDWRWKRFIEVFAEIGEAASVDLREPEPELKSKFDLMQMYFDEPEDPEIPAEILSGQMARKHVFGRTDLGDYRNKIKNTNGVLSGVTVHVKAVIEDNRIRNVLTIEDVGGDCQVINVVSSSGKKLVVNVGRLPQDAQGQIEMQKLELV